MTRSAAWLLVAAALAGCKPKTAPAVDAGAADGSAVAVAPLLAVPRVSMMASSICLLYPDAPALCAQEKGKALVFYPVSKEPVVETAEHTKCYLTKAGEAFCRDNPAAAGVLRVGGAPYLLGARGLLVAPGGAEEDDTLRGALVSALPRGLLRIVAAQTATCALAATGEVWCWPEPSFGFNDRDEDPIAPRPKSVPGQRDVIDLTLANWLTLCTLSKSGAVACTSGAAGKTEVCELRRSHDARCGRAREGPMGPAPLVGPGYDPRQVLEAPLVPVPGFDGADAATTIRAWATRGAWMLESGRRLFVDGGDEGGCARHVSGAVRCFERDLSRAGLPWRSTLVEGLPPNVTRIEVGAFDGYALTAAGALYTWPRRLRSPDLRTGQSPARAFSMRAERVASPDPIVDVAGGIVQRWRHPGTTGVDCAVSASAVVTCWETGTNDRTPLAVTRSGTPEPPW